ncbi:hypothetical protein AB0K45_09475 [Micrococcus luteus]|uniref:hypothetical protein n=1 Tax=Micrococcus luteus TaxID=1270 RepID=UPI003429A6E3
MSNPTVLSAIIGGLFLIVMAAVGFWIKRIEGKDKLFRNSVTKDMRVMYAIKDDYSHIHTWALDVRSAWNEKEREAAQMHIWAERVNENWQSMQQQLQASGAITEIHPLPPIPRARHRALPPIPEPEWRRIEDGDDRPD